MTITADHEVDTIRRVLAATPVGEVCTHRQIADALGRTPQPYLLQRALKRENEESGALFVNVFRQGYRRVSAAEAGSVTAKAHGTIRRKARRTAKTVRNAVSRTNDLPAPVAKQLSGDLARLGMIEFLTTRKAADAVEREQPDADQVSPSPAAKTMAGMRKALGME